MANVDSSASHSSIKLTGSRSLLQMFNLILQMLNWIEILRLGSLLQQTEFTVMFMEPFLDNSVHVAWGITPLKKSFGSSAFMLLGMRLIGNSTLLSCGIEPLLLFYQGSKYVPQRKKTTHHRAAAWCVAWLMHVLMWIFLCVPVFSSVYSSGNQDSSVFPIV